MAAKRTRKRTAKRAAKRAARKGAARQVKRAKRTGEPCMVNGAPIPAEWLELLLELPEYDPRAHATLQTLELDGTDEGTLVEVPCTFDVRKAERAVRFIETQCVHVKGKLAGKHVKLERWQKAVVANLFGWVRPDGTRRYRECLVYVPRKNGKTTLAACIVAYLLCSDGEQGAEIYSAAGAQDQAATIWRILDRMRELNPDLAKRTQSYSQARSIVYPSTGSTYRAVPSDAKSLHGGDSHGVVIDELHVLKANAELVEVLTTSTGAREQPVVLYLTTADFAGESVCNDTLRRAHEVQRTEAAPAVSASIGEFLPVVYEATRDDDWTKPGTWAKANPNLGISLKPGYLSSKVQVALRSPAKRNTFLRLHLNVQTDADVAWVPMELWDACTGAVAWDKLQDELAGQDLVAYGGLDLASRRDLAAFALFFPDVHAMLWWVWMPEARARQLAADQGDTRWLAWGEQGALELCKGRSINQGRIRRRVREASERFNIATVGFDRWNAGKIRGELEGDGLTMVEFGQGYRDMSEPTKELEQLWLDELLRHGGHPVARQTAANTMVREDEAGNIKPNKAKSSGPIDPIVAAIMAVGGALTAEPPEDTSSVYEDRGVLRLGG